jgi:hypothetical protein
MAKLRPAGSGGTVVTVLEMASNEVGLLLAGVTIWMLDVEGVSDKLLSIEQPIWPQFSKFSGNFFK